LGSGSLPLITLPIQVQALPLLFFLLSVDHPAAAAGLNPDTAALQFYGFRAGARLGELDEIIRRLDGGRLRCQPAKADRSVSECRATLAHPELGGPVSLWVSAIDSVAGVITLSSSVAPQQLNRWRESIETRYGRVSARAQGSQWMMQWVRRGRMLRLTWRQEKGGQVASVSLVDGRVLDAWGKRRTRKPDHSSRIRKLPSDSSNR
jgi:hypothetical protein